MKGPSLQHELKVLRNWKCPSCGRSVRTSGSVTARTCDCADQTQMQYVEQSRPGPPDVSSFVTYLAPDYLVDDDDGTDLPVPDIEDLVMPAPETRGRRDRGGRPLRDVVPEDSPAAEEQAFGEGLDEADELSAPIPAAGQNEADSGVPPTGDRRDDSPGEKRRPRRRRRRGDRGRRNRTADGDMSQPVAAAETESATTAAAARDGAPTHVSSTAGGEDVPTQSHDASDGSSAPRKRRRRRRRRGSRRNTSSDSDAGDGGSAPNSDGGRDS